MAETKNPNSTQGRIQVWSQAWSARRNNRTKTFNGEGAACDCTLSFSLNIVAKHRVVIVSTHNCSSIRNRMEETINLKRASNSVPLQTQNCEAISLPNAFGSVNFFDCRSQRLDGVRGALSQACSAENMTSRMEISCCFGVDSRSTLA